MTRWKKARERESGLKAVISLLVCAWLQKREILRCSVASSSKLFRADRHRRRPSGPAMGVETADSPQPFADLSQVSSFPGLPSLDLTLTFSLS